LWLGTLNEEIFCPFPLCVALRRQVSLSTVRELKELNCESVDR